MLASPTERPAGVVASVAADSLLIAAKDGLVSLLNVQPAGKRVMTAAEFLRGHRVEVGDRFGGETL